ncbi:MAG: YfhO family protein [Chloroflexi bacterium]|nr:YfhO family protein [Chloroflexota bacterium]
MGLPVAVVSGAVLAWGGEIVLGSVPTWGATALQFQPWQQAVAAAYRAGQLPLWTSLAGFGAPLAANPQAAAFSPFTVLSVVAGGERGVALSLLLHGLVAGLGGLLAARRLGIPPGPATLAGVVAALGGALAARAVFPPFFATASWLGLAIAAWPYAPRRPHAAVRPALVLALAWLDGHPQAWLMVALASGLAALWFSVREGSERWRVLGGLLLGGGAVLMTLGLVAFQVLPALELFVHSGRVSGLSNEQVAPYDPPPWAALLLLAPDLLGLPAMGDYRGPVGFWEWCWTVGLVALPLAALARCGLPVLLFGVSVALAFLPGLPVVGGMGRLLSGGEWLRGAGRWLVLADFALALLAAAGLARLLALPPASQRRVILRTAAVGAGVILGGLVALPLGGGPLVRAGAGLVGASLVLALAVRFGWLVAALAVAAELVLFSRPLLPLGPAGWPTVSTPGPLLTPEPRFLEQFFAAFPLDQYDRPFPLPASAAHLPNRGLVNGYRDVLPYDPLRLAATERALAAAGEDARALARLGVAEVAGRGVVSGTRPLVSWATRAVVVPDETAALARLADPALAEDTIVLIDRPPLPPPEGLPAAEQALIIREASAGRYWIETASPDPGFLRVLESSYPGWRVWVDGRPAALTRAEGVFLAVPLSAGRHRVLLAYLPGSWLLGLAVSAIAWPFVIRLALVASRSRR